MKAHEGNIIQLKKPAIVIVGPTASGKTDLAQEIAVHYGAEIVSADSMQIYKGMDIGTSKLPHDSQRVRHFGLDICEPNASYSVAQYQYYARQCFCSIDKRGKRVVLCGGTGLYIGAALYDFRFPKGGQINNSVRDRYTRIAEKQGAQALWDMLREVDPSSAVLIHPNNIRRVVRAFEMLEEGTSYAEQNKHADELSELVPNIQIGLSYAPELLARRIEQRVDAMIDAGLVEEVTHLLDSGLRESLTSPQAIGYKEIVRVLDGDCSLDEAIASIKQATRRYAKRQRTWFKRDARIHWIDANDKKLIDLKNEAMALIEANDKNFG